MNMEAVSFLVLMTMVLTLISLSLIPVTAMAMSRTPQDAVSNEADSAGGAACSLPPDVEVSGDGDANTAYGPPPLDKEVSDVIKTATFAMG